MKNKPTFTQRPKLHTLQALSPLALGQLALGRLGPRQLVPRQLVALILLTAAASAAPPSLAQAQTDEFSTISTSTATCILTLRILPSPNVNFDAAETPTQFAVEVSRQNRKQACAYWIGFSSGAAGPSYMRVLRHQTDSQASIKYGLFKNPCQGAPPNCANPQLKDRPSASASDEVITGSFTAAQTELSRRHSIYPVYPLEPVNQLPTQRPFKRAGPYSDTVEVSVYESQFPNPNPPAPDARVSLSLAKTIEKFAKVSIVDPGAPYSDPPVTTRTVDFGIIEAGETQSFDLISLFNAGFRLTLSSDNGGVLKSLQTSTHLPYNLKISEGPPLVLPPGLPVTIASGGGVSPPPTSGFRTKLKVTLTGASLKNTLAGLYSDTLTVTITSVE